MYPGLLRSDSYRYVTSEIAYLLFLHLRLEELVVGAERLDVGEHQLLGVAQPRHQRLERVLELARLDESRVELAFTTNQLKHTYTNTRDTSLDERLVELTRTTHQLKHSIVHGDFNCSATYLQDKVDLRVYTQCCVTIIYTVSMPVLISCKWFT